MRRSRINLKVKSEKLRIRTKTIIFIILFLTFLFLIFIIFKVLTLDKFIYVNKVNDGSAEIIIVDPDRDKAYKYLIPAETKLDSARGYGEYKISSLWSLSEKDKNGKLVSETITKNYFLPVYQWKNDKKSNLSFFQKIKSFLISRKFNSYNETIMSNKIPNSILINFVNPIFLDSIPKIDIEDLTGSLNTAEKVSKIIEVIGGKITSNSKGYDANLDCEIISRNLITAKIFVNIFNCDSKIDNSESILPDQIDLKIRLGAKFVERF